MLEHLELWGKVLFSLLDSYSLPISVFPISSTKMKVNSSSTRWSSFIFSQMLLFKSISHCLEEGFISSNSSPWWEGCNFSCFAQTGTTSFFLIGRKNEFICFESINVLNLAGKTPWTYLLSAKQQIIWTWTCSHVQGRCSGRICTFGRNQGH